MEEEGTGHGEGVSGTIGDCYTHTRRVCSRSGLERPIVVGRVTPWCFCTLHLGITLAVPQRMSLSWLLFLLLVCIG